MMSSARKMKILDTTQSIIVEHGGAYLTMRKVADGAGISLGNLQYHFPNREHLLQALLSSFIAEYEATTQDRSFRPSGDPERDLRKFFLAIFKSAGLPQSSAVFKFLWSEAQQNGEMDLALKDYYRRLGEFYAALFERISHDGVPTERIAIAVSIIVPLTEGYCITGDVESLGVSALAESWAALLSPLLTAAA